MRSVPVSAQRAAKWGIKLVVGKIEKSVVEQSLPNEISFFQNKQIINMINYISPFSYF